MAEPETFVIVGAGLAGARGAQALRENAFSGRLLLIGEETVLPYERPPLSKGYLLGQEDFDRAYAHDQDWYRSNEVELRLGVRVDQLDRQARQVELSDGSAVNYDRLLLTTGATPRRLPIPGADHPGVLHLRDVEDCERLKRVLDEASRLIVIGAGWIGLEVAAAARIRGVSAVVAEQEQLPLLDVLGPEVAEVFAGLHREHGVEFHFGARAEEILTSGDRAVGVRLSDGTRLNGDAVLVAAGVRPNTQLAEQAQLEVQDGVVVDAGLRSSDPNVFAAGDVAAAQHPLLRQRIRVEHWANALHQPAVAAAGMLGRTAEYRELPYFFTDQYDLGMEYRGHIGPAGYDRVVFRGDVDNREFISFWLRDGVVLAGMNVNIWDAGDEIERLLASGAPVDPDRLADPSTPLSESIAR